MEKISDVSEPATNNIENNDGTGKRTDIGRTDEKTEKQEKTEISLTISGRSKLKVKKKALYKVKVSKGIKAKKIKWAVKKGKKLVKIKKKTKQKILLTAKKTGRVVIVVRYGKVSAKKIISIVKR